MIRTQELPVDWVPIPRRLFPICGRAGDQGYRVVRILLGVLFLVASLLKAYEVMTPGVADAAFFTPRWLVIGAVVFEWVFGLWLLIGLHSGPTRRVAIMCFAVFALVALSKAVAGESSCHCFGTLIVPPWITFSVDAAAAMALLAFRPSGLGSSIGSNPLRVAFLLTVSVWVGGVWGMALVNFDLDRNHVVLRTESWVGSRFPILNQVEIDENISEGSWVVILYHHDCDRCKEALPIYEHRAREQKGRPGAQRFALVELPPFGKPGVGIIPSDSPCSLGRLPASITWVVRTPAEIILQNGIVIASNSSAKGIERPVVGRNRKGL